jgi:AhpD family alkylhydroperoxidase
MMPHIPPLSTEQSGDARATLESLQAKLGGVTNMYRTIAHAPRVLDATVSMMRAIRVDLDAKFRELVYLKVTQMTDCHVCRHYHEAAARRAGLTERQISELGTFEQSDTYAEMEKDILRFAEQWTLQGRIADEVMARLKSDLSPAQLVLLAATTAQANWTTRFNNVFGVELT